jgi:hypothetical protein
MHNQEEYSCAERVSLCCVRVTCSWYVFLRLRHRIEKHVDVVNSGSLKHTRHAAAGEKFNAMLRYPTEPSETDISFAYLLFQCMQGCHA